MKSTLVAVCLMLSAPTMFGAAGVIVRGAKPVPGRYIVLLERAVGPVERVRDQLVREHGGKVVYTYDSVFPGFALETTEVAALAISRSPLVRSVEQDNEGDLASHPVSDHWALDRIDDRISDRVDGTYNVCDTGQGVYVYVFDTGIWAGHNEFSNLAPNGMMRVRPGYDAWHRSEGNTSADPCTIHRGTSSPTRWTASHGTAVASLIGGQTMGVGKNIILRPIRIADCSGKPRVAEFLAAVNWLLKTPNQVDIDSGLSGGDLLWGEGTPRVANMSFTFEYDASKYDATKDCFLNNKTTCPDWMVSVDQAVQRLIDAKFTVVAAAGNFTTNIHTTARSFTPARVPGVITVGGSKGQYASEQDTPWDVPNPEDLPDNGVIDEPGTNYGAEVDIFAPAHNVKSAHYDSADAIRTQYKSGTSFAAPLVAGVAATILQVYPEFTAEQVWGYIRDEATTTVHGLNMPNLNGSPNRLLWIQTGCRVRIVGP